MTTGRRKRREGVVVSNKMDKTVVVVVERLVRHSQYHKFLRQRERLQRLGFGQSPSDWDSDCWRSP